MTQEIPQCKACFIGLQQNSPIFAIYSQFDLVNQLMNHEALRAEPGDYGTGKLSNGNQSITA